MATLLLSVNSSQTPAAELTDTIQLAISSVLLCESLLSQLDKKVLQLLFCDLSPNLDCKLFDKQGQLLLTLFIP